MTFAPIGQSAKTLAQKKASEVGPKHGATGSAVSHGNTSVIVEWLAAHSPADVDKAAVSRAKSHGVDLRVKLQGRYPNGPNGEYLPSYMVAVGCEVSGENREAVLADLLKLQTPPETRMIEEWLAELSVLTAGRQRDGIEAGLMLNAYSSRLGRYPADVVHFALREKSWKWFPTWEELEKVCETLAGPRRHMIAALTAPPPDAEPEWQEPTPEERARIQALVDEMFPAVSQEWRDAAVDKYRSLEGEAKLQEKPCRKEGN